MIKNVYKPIFGSINQFYRNQKVVMLHTARCGSTVLAKMLNSHSQIFWGGELFNNVNASESKRSKKELIEFEIHRNANRRVSKIHGFEAKYLPYQILAKDKLNLDLNSFIGMLKTQGYEKFILLHRKNYLRRILSVEIGRLTNIWHSNKNKSKPQRIYLDIEKVHTADYTTSLLELFESIDLSYQQAKDYLKNVNMLSITYEEDIYKSPVVAYEKVCSFLSIPVENCKIVLRKTNPFKVCEMVENFEEVEKVLKGTVYEWMLYD